MILATIVIVAVMPVIMVIACTGKIKAAYQKRKWHAEHIDVTYRKPSPTEENNNFLKAVNSYIVNRIDNVRDLKISGTMFSGVITVYVKTDKENKILRLFKRRTDKGWEFTEDLGEEMETSFEAKRPQGEKFNDDDLNILENI